MWNIEKTVRVNPHAAAADSHSNKEKKTDMLILKTELPRSSVQHEFDIPTASIQRLGIFMQQWLKTLPAESAITTYLSSGISTSEKFLISMAHLLDPKGSVMTPPLLNLSEHLQRFGVNIRNMSNAEMRARQITWKSSRPAQGVDPRSAPHESCAVGVPRPAPRSSVLPVALDHPATAVQPETARATVEQKHANVHLQKSHHSKLDAWCMFFWFDLGGHILNIEIRAN